MFKYKVQFWDKNENKVVTEIGLTGAKKWGKACKAILEYYGEDEVNSIELTPYEDVVYAEAVIEDMQDALAAE